MHSLNKIFYFKTPKPEVIKLCKSVKAIRLPPSFILSNTSPNTRVRGIILLYLTIYILPLKPFLLYVELEYPLKYINVSPEQTLTDF